MVEYMGEPYISLTQLKELIVDMEEFVSLTVSENPDAENLLPGAQAVLSMLNNIFENVQRLYADSKDLAPEATQTIKEIYDFLREQ